VYAVQGVAEPQAGLATQPLFFLLMSVSNLGTTGGEWLGGQLYDLIGLHWLIAVSAGTTAACRLLVPWMRMPAPPASA
jgi:predicted MFS family arabinose efflux permease